MNSEIENNTKNLFNDKDILNDILNTEKNISNNYSTALNETSTEQKTKEILEQFIALKEAQRKTFKLLFEKGWYKLTSVEKEKIHQKKEEYNNLLKDLKNN